MSTGMKILYLCWVQVKLKHKPVNVNLAHPGVQIVEAQTHTN